MTVDDYIAAVHLLPLTPTNVPGIRRTKYGEMQCIPDPSDLLPEQRQAIIDRLRAALADEA